MTEHEALVIKAYLWGKHVPVENAEIQVLHLTRFDSWSVSLGNGAFRLTISSTEAWEFFKRAWEVGP